MQFQIQRTDNQNPEFQRLVNLLDGELKVFDGDDHPFYDQFNKIDAIKHAVILLHNQQAVACGAIKEYESQVMEIKRMFVHPLYRNSGYATRVLQELEVWSKELGAVKCILETGIRQKSAIKLYEKNLYQRIPNYGQYAGVVDSFCFEKMLLI